MLKQPRYRPYVATCVSVVLIFWSHKTLKMQHHRHCSADLFRIVLFGRSNMCTHIATLLNLVEATCGHAVTQYSSYAYIVRALVNQTVLAGLANAAPDKAYLSGLLARMGVLSASPQP